MVDDLLDPPLLPQAEIALVPTAGDDSLIGTANRDELRGLGGGEWIRGLGGDDLLVGGMGRDILRGSSGDDILRGGEGDDRLFGGGGADLARYAGEIGDFEIERIDDHFVLIDRNVADGDEGADTVAGVETFVFAGTRYAAADLMAYVTAARAVATEGEATSWDSYFGGGPIQGVAVIAAGDRVILDQSVEVAGLAVLGDLRVADTASEIEFTTDWAAVADGGLFQVGSKADPYAGQFTLTLTGDDRRHDVDLSEFGATGALMPITNNNAFLMAMGEGSRIEIHADDAEKESWTQLRRTADAGDSTLYLTEKTGWQVGDRIAVASTDFDMEQAEELTITAVRNGGREIDVDRPLDFMHYGEIETYSSGAQSWDVDMRVEVALLSRDVAIQGDADSVDDGYGGHVMTMRGAEMRVSGAEFTRMGQEGTLGRYTLHWHIIGDGSGQYVEDVSIHNGYNKGVTIHGSTNVRVEDVVVYETVGHNFFFEDGVERDNRIIDNLSINTRATDREFPGLESDFNEVSGFWIENPDNTFIGNHAAGSENAGFWVVPPRTIGEASANSGLFDDRLRPNRLEWGVFQDNTAHSTALRGFAIGGAEDNARPRPEDAGGNVAPAQVAGLTLFKNDDAGVYAFADNIDFVDAAIAENGRGSRLNGPMELVDTLILGETDNIGMPEPGDPRSYATGTEGDLVGFRDYDGPVGMRHVHFDRFEGDMMAITAGNGIQKSLGTYATGVKFGDRVGEDNRIELDRLNTQFGYSNSVFIDLDGSLTGQPGAKLVPDYGEGNRINAAGNYEVREEWGALILPASVEHALFELEATGIGPNAQFPLITQSDGESFQSTRGSMDLAVVTGRDLIYTYTYDQLPRTLTLDLSFAERGASTLAEFEGMGGAASVDGAIEVRTLNQLRAADGTAFARINGSLYIKMVIGEDAAAFRTPRSGDPDTDRNTYSETITIRS